MSYAAFVLDNNARRANLDRLPPKGAILIAAPLKIRQGTGSPIRALALVPRG